jgi:hypothetical protein
VLVLALAAGVYLAAGVWAAVSFGTWTDEEYTLATTAHGVGYALSRAMTYELQAPLYFGILAAWREIDPSVWFARLFSVLCATAFIFVLAKIGARVAPEFEPVPFALLGALNPFVVMAALEIRLYALALLISGVMWLTFDDGFASGASRKARIAFVLLSICGITVQYFLAFMLVGFGCGLVVLRRPTALAAFVACSSIVGLATVPLAMAAHSQLGGYETLVKPPLLPLVLSVGHWFVALAFPRDFTWNALPLGRPSYLTVVGLTFVTVGLARPRFSRQLLALLACAAAIQLAYVALAAALLQQLNERYFVALFLPVATATYAMFRAVRQSPRPGLALAFASCVLLTVLALFSQYRFLAHPGDWKRVAPYLASHATRNDIIAVYPADGLLAFRREYRIRPSGIRCARLALLRRRSRARRSRSLPTTGASGLSTASPASPKTATTAAKWSKASWPRIFVRSGSAASTETRSTNSHVPAAPRRSLNAYGKSAGRGSRTSSAPSPLRRMKIATLTA